MRARRARAPSAGRVRDGAARELRPRRRGDGRAAGPEACDGARARRSRSHASLRPARDPSRSLHSRNPDACCALRKIAPLRRALADHSGWITGRKRYQSGTRAHLEFFEVETGKIKVNPLARRSPQDIREYMEENRLPRHPLVAQGYPSIGCAPCTSKVETGEDPRAGRWRDQDKDECGIHFVNGKLVRAGT